MKRKVGVEDVERKGKGPLTLTQRQPTKSRVVKAGETGRGRREARKVRTAKQRARGKGDGDGGPEAVLSSTGVPVPNTTTSTWGRTRARWALPTRKKKGFLRLRGRAATIRIQQYPTASAARAKYCRGPRRANDGTLRFAFQAQARLGTWALGKIHGHLRMGPWGVPSHPVHGPALYLGRRLLASTPARRASSRDRCVPQLRWHIVRVHGSLGSPHAPLASHTPESQGHVLQVQIQMLPKLRS